MLGVAKIPNYCDIDLYINGKKKEVERFKKKCKGKNGIIDFNNFVPYPKKLKEQDEKYWRVSELEKKKRTRKEDKELMLLKLSGDKEETDGYNSGGHDWCVLNWDTKWNACLDNSEWEYDYDIGSCLSEKITFSTAWTPPIKVIEAMAKQFPKLIIEIRYFEGAMNFNGRAVFEKGKLKSMEDGKYFGDRGG